jgi:hypothetical protein
MESAPQSCSRSPLTSCERTSSSRWQLCFDPEADQIHIEFRRNGAMFFFTTDEPPEAALAAGPARWRMTFDLLAYRAAFRDAVQAEASEHVLA